MALRFSGRQPGHPLQASGAVALGRLLGGLLSHHLQHAFAEGLPHPDCLLAVPLGRRRLRQRGFNQSEMLARWLATDLQLPVHSDWLLRRGRRAPAGTGRRRAQNAICARPLPCRRAAVTGLHLALVDDVLTTGATRAEALPRLLPRAGARRIDVIAWRARPNQATEWLHWSPRLEPAMSHPLRHPHPRPGSSTPWRPRLPQRRPRAGAEQLREPRLPGGIEDDQPLIASSTARTAGAMRRSARNTPSAMSWPVRGAGGGAPSSATATACSNTPASTLCPVPRRGGRARSQATWTSWYRLGQLLGRLHAVGASRPFRAPRDTHSGGLRPCLLDTRWTAVSCRAACCRPTSRWRATCSNAWTSCSPACATSPIRLHGDCHPGNLLHRDDAFHVVDLDDCCMGPHYRTCG